MGHQPFVLSLDDHPSLKTFAVESGLKTVPQVFLNGHLIGGHDETVDYLHQLAAQSRE